MAATTARGSAGESRTGQRTHRYLRLALGGQVAVILTAVSTESVRSGQWLPSISHAYYTPAGPVFVGSLIAVAVAMFALSGKDAETTLLDIAALFAPLVALVPTVIGEGDLPGVATGCREECVPDSVRPTVMNGVTSYLVVLALLIVLGVVLRVRRVVTACGMIVSLAAAGVVGVALTVFAIVPALQNAFLLGAHIVAAALFFAAFGLVALVNAFRAVTDPDSRPQMWQKVVYVAVPAVLLIDAVVVAVFLLAEWETSFPVVFVAESIALVLFALFWFVQTAQRWDEEVEPVDQVSPRLAWRSVPER